MAFFSFIWQTEWGKDTGGGGGQRSAGRIQTQAGCSQLYGMWSPAQCTEIDRPPQLTHSCIQKNPPCVTIWKVFNWQHLHLSAWLWSQTVITDLTWWKFDNVCNRWCWKSLSQQSVNISGLWQLMWKEAVKYKAAHAVIKTSNQWQFSFLLKTCKKQKVVGLIGIKRSNLHGIADYTEIPY